MERRLAGRAFIFCEARAFREVGGFSLELYAAEELDLFQASQNGWPAPRAAASSSCTTIRW
jgi:hypothetical protein